MNNIPLQLVGRKTLWPHVNKISGEEVLKQGTIVGDNTDDYYKNKLDDEDSEDLDKLWLDDAVWECDNNDIPSISNEVLARVVRYETQQHPGAQYAYNTLPFFFQYFQQLQYWQSTTTLEPVGRFQHRYPFPLAYEDSNEVSSIKLKRLSHSQRKVWAMKAIRHAFCPPQCLYQQWSMYYHFSTLVPTFEHPTSANTEKPLEVNSPLHSVLEHALFCVASLRGAIKIKDTSMIRVLHATYQGVKNLSDPNFVKKKVKNADINRIRCVYIILQSGCQRLKHNNIICQQTGDVLVVNETAQRCFQYRKSSSRKHPTIVLECRVLLPILYDFKPHFSRLPTPEASLQNGWCQLERLVYLAKKHGLKDVELVSRMRLSLEKGDATIHAEVRHELFYGTVTPVGKGEGSLILAEDFSIAVYGGFLAEATQVERWSEKDGHALPNSRFRLDAVRSSKSGAEVGKSALATKFRNRLQGKKKTFLDVANSFLNKYQDKKKHWTQRVLMLTHGCQYCLLWNHMARKNHITQYRTAIQNIIGIKELENVHDLLLAVIDGKKPDMHAIEKIDLYLECLCLLPNVSDHLEKETCQKFSDAILPYVLNEPSNQFYHLYMVVQFVILAYDHPIQHDEPMELVQVLAGKVSETYAKVQSNPPMYKAIHGSNRISKYTVQSGSSMWFLSTSEKEQDDQYYNQSSSDMVPSGHWKNVYPNKHLPPCHMYTQGSWEREINSMPGKAWAKHREKRNCYGKKGCVLENCMACQPSKKRRKKSFTKEACWCHLRCVDVEGKECMEVGNVPEGTLVAWKYEGYYFQYRRGKGVDPVQLQYVDREGNVLPCEDKWMVAADDMVYVLENGFLLTRFHNSHAIVGKKIQDLKLMDWVQMTVPKWNTLHNVQEHRISEQNGRFFREDSPITSLHEYEAVRRALALREFMLTQVPMLTGATLVPGQTYLRLKQHANEHTAWHTDYQNVVEDRDDNTIDATNWDRVRTVWVPLHDMKKATHSILQFRHQVKNGYTVGEYVIFGLKEEHMANASKDKPRYSMDFRVILKT